MKSFDDDGRVHHCSYTGAYDTTWRRFHLCSFCDEICYSFKDCIAHQATHKDDEGLKEQIVEKNMKMELPDEQIMEEMVKTELPKEQTMDKRLKMELPEPEEHTTDKKVDMGRPEEQTVDKRVVMEILQQPTIEKRAKMELRGLGLNRYNPYPPSKMSKVPTHGNIAFGISQNRYGGSSSRLAGGVTKPGVSRHSVKNDSNAFSGSMEMVEKKESDNSRPIRILGFTVHETGVSDGKNDIPAGTQKKRKGFKAEPIQRTPRFDIDLNVIDLSD